MMMKRFLLVAGASAAMVLSGTMANASQAPLDAADANAVGIESVALATLLPTDPSLLGKPGASETIKVAQRWRRRRRRARRRFRRGVAVGVGAAVLGAIIINEAAKAERRKRRRRYDDEGYGDPYDRCADRFRSFRYSDGTYQPYGGGPRELCPYL